MYCDLHVHTHFSADSLCPPEDVMRLAGRSGCRGLACADHDALDAIPIFQAGAAEAGVEFIPGVEIDTDHPVFGHLHILGYGFDPAHPAIRAVCDGELDFGTRVYEAALERLVRAGAVADRTAYEAWARGDWPRRRIGPKQLIAWLARGGVAGGDEAAKGMYLEAARAAGLTHSCPHPRAAIAAVRAAGGVAVFAHPAYEAADRLEEAVDEVLACGAAGLEAYTPSNRSDGEVRRVVDIARDRGVIVTGGSDYHGPATIDRWPSQAPYECFEALRDLLGGGKSEMRISKSETNSKTSNSKYETKSP